MRRFILIISVFPLFYAGCNDNNDTADAFGNFEAIEFLVSAENSGKIIQFNVEEGDKLKADQKIGLIDTIQLSLKIEQLNAGLQSIYANIQTINAQIESTKVQRSNLQRELDRVERMFEQGAATSKQLDDLKGELDLVNSRINTFEIQKRAVITERTSIGVQIEQIRDQIRRAIISNPIDGVILQKYKQQGELVMTGQNLYKIANLDNLILRVYISGNQLSEISIGEEVRVMFDSPEGLQEISGTVTWVSAESEFTPKIIQTREERVSMVYAMKIKVKNDGRLKIGMPGEVIFE